MNIGEKIKHLRILSFQKQGDIAKLFDVANNTISQWETGKNEPNAKTLLLLAKHFGVTIQSLMDDEQDLVYISEQSGAMETITDLAAIQNQIKELQTENSTLKDQIIKLQSQLLSEMQKKKY